MSGNGISPLETWRELARHLEERPLTEMSKDDYLASIVDALDRVDFHGKLDMDPLRARALAHACHEHSYLLSPVEKAFLSIAVFPSFNRNPETNVSELQFHNRLWQEATAALPKKYYPAVVELLFFVAEKLDCRRLFAYGRDILAMTGPFRTNKMEELNYEDLRQHMDCRERHPAYRDLRPPTPR